MKVLNGIESENIIAIDIETVRYTDTYYELSDEFKSAWQYKNKQDGEIPSEEALNEQWIKVSSLWAEFSKVCAISLAFLNKEGSLVVKEFYGEDEKKLLSEFIEFINRIIASGKDYRLIGHASKYFDIPFLSKRLIINDLPITNMLDYSNAKPWEHKNLDTNELWRSFGTGPGSSLQALCTVLDVPISKVDLVGDEVGTAYFKGEIERIKDYCTLDTVATFNIFRRFKREPIFGRDEYKVLENEPKQEPLPVLKRLRNFNEITPDIEKELLEILSGKVEERELKYIEDILKAAFFRDDFISGDQDTKDVRAEKEETIKLFLEDIKN